jgi:hypothetical protein
MRDSETVALALLAFRRTYLHRVIPVDQCWLNSTGDPALDCIMIEHNGFACAGAYSHTLLQMLATSFASGSLPSDELFLPGIAAGIPIGTGLIDAGHTTRAFCAPLKRLEGAKSIGPLLSRNARQQLRRSIRAFELKGPLSVKIASEVDVALEFFEGLKAFHTRSWMRRGRGHAFVTPFFEKFHRALIVDGFAERNVDLVRVSAGPYILGYLYNFRRNGTVLNYQSGFNDGNAGLRPGYVCHALTMSHYAALGMSHYDFLAGTNRLKQSFASLHYELSWRRLRKKTPMFRVEALARRASRRIGKGH